MLTIESLISVISFAVSLFGLGYAVGYNNGKNDTKK